jgi:hypothetical protein
LFEQLVGIFANLVFFYVGLKLPRVILEMEERSSSERPEPDNPAGHCKKSRIVHIRFFFANMLPYVLDPVRHLEIVGIKLDTLISQCLCFFSSLA